MTKLPNTNPEEVEQELKRLSDEELALLLRKTYGELLSRKYNVSVSGVLGPGTNQYFMIYKTTVRSI